MATKQTYRCPVIGAGVDGNEFRPRTSLYVADWRIREACVPGAKTCTVDVVADPLQHTLIQVDTLIQLIL